MSTVAQIHKAEKLTSKKCKCAVGTLESATLKIPLILNTIAKYLVSSSSLQFLITPGCYFILHCLCKSSEKLEKLPCSISSFFPFIYTLFHRLIFARSAPHFTPSSSTAKKKKRYIRLFEVNDAVQVVIGHTLETNYFYLYTHVYVFSSN